MMIASAVVMGGFGVFEFYTGIARLAWLMLPIAVVFGVTGVVLLRIAKKHDTAA